MNINLLDKRNLPNLKDFSEIENPLCLRPFQEEKEAKPVWGTNVIERSIWFLGQEKESAVLEREAIKGYVLETVGNGDEV